MEIALVLVAVPERPSCVGVMPLSTEVSGVFKIAPGVDSDEIPNNVEPVTAVTASRPKFVALLIIML